MSLILEISTSSTRGSLRLNDSQEKIHSIQWVLEKSHSEIITTKLRKLLLTSNKKLTELSHILLDVGPGSFTGVRVGVNLARCLGYANNTPITPISSLEMIARQTMVKSNNLPVVAIVGAVRNIVFAGKYDSTGKEIIAPRAYNSDELAKLLKGQVLVAGYPIDRIKNIVTNTTNSKFPFVECFPSAEGFPHLDQDSKNNPPSYVWNFIEPLYLRGSEAEEKLKENQSL